MARNRDQENAGAENPNAGDPSLENPDASQTAENPNAENPPPAPPSSGEKVRLKCNGINGGEEVVIGTETVIADKDGIIEVDLAAVARLLTIPGYEKA